MGGFGSLQNLRTITFIQQIGLFRVLKLNLKNTFKVHSFPCLLELNNLARAVVFESPEVGTSLMV